MMKAEHFTLLDASAHGAVRSEQHQGRSYTVVPVIALKEGVIHAMNSDCDEFVPASELHVHGWEQKPLFVGHPLVNGRPVSGAHPQVASTAVGFVRHAAVGDGRLTMEAWVDDAKADDELLDVLRANLGMDVSVGVFTANDDTAGEHDGKRYESTWRGIRPDHLALLPKDTGACSWEMGCGVRAAGMRNAWQTTTGHHTGGGFEVHRGSEPDSQQSVHTTRDDAEKSAKNLAKTHDDTHSVWQRHGTDVTMVSAHHSDGRGSVRSVKYASRATDHAQAATVHDLAAVAHEEAALQHASSLSTVGFNSDPRTQATAQAITASQTADQTSKSVADLSRSLGENDRAQALSLDAARASAQGNWPLAQSTHAAAASAHRGAARDHRSAAFENKMRNAQLDNLEEELHDMELVELDEALKTLRSIPKSVRDKMDRADFAGPNESFPIEQAGDVANAARALGRAKGDHSAIKAKIISIAKRKGASFVAQLPDDWKEPKDAVGKRNSADDQARIQAMHDKAVELGADCSVKDAAAGCTCRLKEAAMEKKDRVKALIGVKNSGFTEADAKWLEQVPDDRLEAYEILAAGGVKAAGSKADADQALADHATMKAAAAKKEEKAEEPKDAAIKALKATGKCVLGDAALKACSLDEINAMIAAATPAKFEDLLATAKPEMRDAILEGQRVGEARKADTIKVLRDSKRCDHTDAELKAMSQLELDRLVKLADLKAPAVDYSGQGTSRAADESKLTVAAAPDLNAAIKAKNAKK